MKGSKRVRVEAPRAGAQQCGEYWCIPVLGGTHEGYVFVRRDEADSLVVHVANVDVDVTAQDVGSAFGGSAVESVTLSPRGEARLRFRSDKAADKALRLPSVTLARSDTLHGYAKYLAECQQRPDPAALAREVDDFMAAFDARTQAAAKANQKQKVDADGFVLVTRKRGRRAATQGDGGMRFSRACTHCCDRRAGDEG